MIDRLIFRLLPPKPASKARKPCSASPRDLRTRGNPPLQRYAACRARRYDSPEHTYGRNKKKRVEVRRLRRDPLLHPPHNPIVQTGGPSIFRIHLTNYSPDPQITQGNAEGGLPSGGLQGRPGYCGGVVLHGLVNYRAEARRSPVRRRRTYVHTYFVEPGHAPPSGVEPVSVVPSLAYPAQENGRGETDLVNPNALCQSRCAVCDKYLIYISLLSI